MLARLPTPGGGFFYTASDHEPLIVRKKDLWDTPVPSSTGLAVTALLRLARQRGATTSAGPPRKPCGLSLA